MGREVLPQVSSPGIEIEIDSEAIAIAVDDRYMIHPQHQHKHTDSNSPPISPFPFSLLPAELRIMVIDSLISSALSAAVASNASIKTAPRSFLENHEAWLLALETVRNVAACSLDLAALMLDSLVRVRLQPQSLRTLGKVEAEAEVKGGSGHVLDDALSELLYEVRCQICTAHGREVLRMRGGEVAEWVRRGPIGLGRDLWGKAPGPDGEGDGHAREAWRRLYGG